MLVPAVFAVLMKMNLYLWDRIMSESPPNLNDHTSLALSLEKLPVCVGVTRGRLGEGK